jgi:protein-tyrosine-phosphatase
MSEKIYNVLFLCTGNSARSILAEALLGRWGRARFRGFSAGSQPKGQVHPMALQLLTRYKLPTEGLRSKSWDEFAAVGPGAPVMDFVFTVCDNAAGEICPVWPGRPVTAHWPVPDPAVPRATEIEQGQAFREALTSLENRIKIFTSLPIAALDRITLEKKLSGIGHLEPEENV